MEEFKMNLIKAEEKLQEQYRHEESISEIYNIMDDIETLNKLKNVDNVSIDHIKILERIIVNMSCR